MRAKIEADERGRPVHVAKRCQRSGPPVLLRLMADGLDQGGEAVEFWECPRCSVLIAWVRGTQLELPLDRS